MRAGNQFELPSDTLCWSHPDGLCVSPIELADTARNTASAYGVHVLHGRAAIDVCPEDDSLIRVTVVSGEHAGRVLDTPRCYLFAGAQSKEIMAQSLQRDAERNQGALYCTHPPPASGPSGMPACAGSSRTHERVGLPR